MSLLDQLLKAGIASKKDVARIERDKKKKRKSSQGNRERKTEQQRREEQAAAQALAAEVEARQLARVHRDREKQRQEHELRVRQIITGNSVRARGKQAFWVKGADGRTLHRLNIAERIAFKLRCGELGVAGWSGIDEPVVISRKSVDKLLEIEPSAVWFVVLHTEGIGEPDETFMQPEWDISLRPHRVRETR